MYKIESCNASIYDHQLEELLNKEFNTGWKSHSITPIIKTNYSGESYTAELILVFSSCKEIII